MVFFRLFLFRLVTLWLEAIRWTFSWHSTAIWPIFMDFVPHFIRSFRQKSDELLNYKSMGLSEIKKLNGFRRKFRDRKRKFVMPFFYEIEMNTKTELSNKLCFVILGLRNCHFVWKKSLFNRFLALHVICIIRAISMDEKERQPWRSSKNEKTSECDWKLHGNVRQY